MPLGGDVVLVGGAMRAQAAEQPPAEVVIHPQTLRGATFPPLAEHPGVAFVVGWNANITVQYEGEATRVPAADIEQYQEAYLNSVPADREFIERGAVRFKATPRWIRYSDFNKEPPELIEIQF